MLNFRWDPEKSLKLERKRLCSFTQSYLVEMYRLGLCFTVCSSSYRLVLVQIESFAYFVWFVLHIVLGTKLYARHLKLAVPSVA